MLWPPTWNVPKSNTLPIIKMDQETKPLPRSGIHLHLLCPASQEPEARGERQKILAGPSNSSASFLSLTGAVANLPPNAGAPSSLESLPELAKHLALASGPWEPAPPLAGPRSPDPPSPAPAVLCRWHP